MTVTKSDRARMTACVGRRKALLPKGRGKSNAILSLPGRGCLLALITAAHSGNVPGQVTLPLPRSSLFRCSRNHGYQHHEPQRLLRRLFSFSWVLLFIHALFSISLLKYQLLSDSLGGYLHWPAEPGGPAGETSILSSVSVVCAVPKLQPHREDWHRHLDLGAESVVVMSCRAENLSEELSTLSWHVGTTVESCFN